MVDEFNRGHSRDWASPLVQIEKEQPVSTPRRKDTSDPKRKECFAENSNPPESCMWSLGTTQSLLLEGAEGAHRLVS
jgi:hypothetical protein